MKRADRIGRLHEQLIKKRDEVFEAHRISEEARLMLQEHDIEPEETAQKEAILDVLATLDEQARNEITAIGRALARIELGEYGLCEICGKRIEIKRLEAVPWASVCGKHARTEGAGRREVNASSTK